MRIRWTDLLLTAAIAAAVPGAAVAEDENLRRDMEEMRNMILQLQDTVQAQSGQIEQQREVIDRAGIEDVRLDGSGSAVSSFLQDIEVNGWLSFTYFINSNDLDNDELGTNCAAGAPCGNIGIPFAGADDNSFTFQQLWFEIGKPATRESRAGFFTEIAFGRDAATLGNAGGFGGGDNLYLNSAYIEYLASLGDFDITFKAGKFGTLIGYEVAQAPYNFNITRGNVYNRLQPITHVGILASMDLPAGFDITLGVVNNPNIAPLGTGGLAPQADGNDNKTFIGHLGYTAESWSVSLNGLVGGTNGGDEEPNYGILDLIVEATPIEGLTLVMNADLVTGDNDSNTNLVVGPLEDSDPNAWGVALTANYDWTERFATAMRYEFVDDDGNVFACSRAPNLVENECQIHSLTGTVAYALTDDLKVRGEVRWDHADIKGFSDQSVYNDSAGPQSDEKQILWGVEAIYEF